jgi:hypothetical protein
MVVASKLVKIIEKNSSVIADRWVDDVTTLPYTRSYWNVPHEELHERADKRLASFYKKLGQNRREQGYRVEEVVMALMLLKRHVWLFILQEGFLTANLELYQALELNNRVVLYFDRAIYYVTQAYSEEDEKEGIV